jgi:hypothetical protein
VLTLPRARANAVMVILAFGGVYALGLVRRTGVLDGFGHVIGGDLLDGRTAGLMVLARRGADLYDFAVQAVYQQAAAGTEQPLPGLIPFIWPPFVAFLYVPWALLPQLPAFALWTVFSLACLVVALLVMAREAPRTGQQWPSALLLALSFYPIMEGLMAGNNSLVALPIFALTYRLLRGGRDGAAGMILGLQLYRPQLAIAPIVVLAAKRRWRALGGVAVIGAGWIALSATLVGPRALVEWLNLGRQLGHIYFAPGMPYALLTSVSALFLIPLGPEHETAAMTMGALASLALLALLLRVWAGPWDPTGDRFAVRFAALLAVAPLVGQYLLLHDVAVLVLAAVLVAEYWLGHPGEGWRRVQVVLAAVWLACLLAPPVVTRVAPLPLAPLAVLLFASAVLYTSRAAASAAAIS